MATVSIPQQTAQLDIHEDTNSAITQADITVVTKVSSDKVFDKQATVLNEVSGNESQSRPRNPSPAKTLNPIGELATELENFHIASPLRQADADPLVQQCQELEAQHLVDTTTSLPLKQSVDERRALLSASEGPSTSVQPQESSKSLEDPLKYHTLVLTGQPLLTSDEQIARHQAVLESKYSKSRHPGAATIVRQRHFGCNLLARKTRSGASGSRGVDRADIYTLLATPIDIKDASLTTGEEDATGASNMSVEAIPSSSSTGAGHIAERQVIAPESPMVKAASPSLRDAGVVSRDNTPRRSSPLRPIPRIEDSFEALDQFEEEVEAVTQAAQLNRILSPDAGKASDPGGAKRNNPVAKGSTRPKNGQSSGVVKPRHAARDSSVRRSVVPASTAKDDKASAKAPVRKAPVPRPASLLPPKPLVKPSRSSILPTFELPGEAVARRLKEKREARLSLQVNSEQVASATPQRTKSLRARPTTIPNFELPGEAISRRKREEHAARLKAQEEEERKRREFKAKPIRTSIAPSTLVRETATSRARTAKAAQQENSAPTQTTSAAGKRLSVAPGSRASRPSMSSTTSSTGAPSRGRDLTVGSPSTRQISRAASSSTGSLSGKRSTMSAEDVQHQKLRGREILQRDNNYLAEREREKREREEAARLARQEAAERSRLLSRQWAEKQRQKKLAATTTVTAANTDVTVQ